MKENKIKCILLLAKEKIIKDLSSDIKKCQMTMKERKQMKENSKNQNGITLIALVITTIFSYDENSKFSNNKGFLLKAI